MNVNKIINKRASWILMILCHFYPFLVGFGAAPCRLEKERDDSDFGELFRGSSIRHETRNQLNGQSRGKGD
jgi:hypothetical protein